MLSFMSRKDKATKERELEAKISKLRAKVSQLDFEKEPKLTGVLLFWLRPFVHLGKVANLTPADVPPAPKNLLTGYTRPIFYHKWNTAIEKFQRVLHQKIQTAHQNHLDAYQKYRHDVMMGVETKKVSKPKELPSRLQQSIPYTVTSVSELHHLPTPEPFLSNPSEAQLQAHLQTHPAVNVLDELYLKNKLPCDIPVDSTASSSPASDNDANVQDDLGDLGSIPEGAAAVKTDAKTPSTSTGSPSPDSDPVLAYTINSEANSMQDIKQPEVVGTWVIFDAWKRPVLIAFAVEIVFVVCNLLQPSCVKKLANYFARYRENASSVGTMEGIGWALLLCILTAVTVTSVLFKIHNQMNWAARSSSSYLTSIFHKLLRTAPYSISNDPSLSPGTIINLTSQDSSVPFNVMIHVLHSVSGPIMLIAALILLYLDDYGSSALITMVMMLILIPYQFAIARLRHWLRRRWLKATDARLQKTISVLQGLRVAKIYSWESKLQDQIQVLRNDELKRLRVSALVQVVSDIFMTVYPLVVTFVTIAHYVSRDASSFNSSKIVVLLSYLNAMRLPIQFLGSAVQSMIELWLSGGRIGHFLSKEELPVLQSRVEAALDQQFQAHSATPNSSQNSSQNSYPGHYSLPTTPVKLGSLHPDPFNTPFVDNGAQTHNQRHSNRLNSDPNLLVKLNNVDFYWSSFEQAPHQTPVLSNISMELRRGDVLGLISASGMGKSALLQGIFGELYPQPSRCHAGLTSITNLIGVGGDLDQGGIPKSKSMLKSGKQYQEFQDEENDRNDQNNQNNPENNQDQDNSLLDGLYSFTNRLEIIPSDLIHLNGRVAYCSQTPWIMNDTIRNNILMGLPFDQTAFQLTVAAASLAPDLEIFPDGDYTLVSEQGVSLSGGQQARLAFGRVLYSVLVGSVDIVILDDIFAAVDAYVARNMFFRGVCGLIKPRCGVVMALNSHYEYLQHCSRTLLLDYTSDTYWLVLHQYILAKQAHLINKATAEKVLLEQNQDLQRSLSLISTPSSLSPDYSRVGTEGVELVGSPSFVEAMKSSDEEERKQQNGQNGYSSHFQRIHKANSFVSHKDSNSNTHAHAHLKSKPSLHQTPLVTNPPLNQPITPAHQAFASVNPSQLYIDPTQLVGFRQPGTITFQGPLSDLLPLNLPLLSNFVQSTMTSEDQEMTDNANIIPDEMKADNDQQNDKNNKNGQNGQNKGTIGQVDLSKEKAQANKLEAKIEGHNKSGSSGPSQANLPSWLYLYWFQGSRGKLGLWVVVISFVIASLASQVFRTGSDVWLVEWADDEARGLVRHHSRNWWLWTTASAMALTFFFFLLQILIYLYVWLDAAYHIHRTAIGRVFQSTIQYLDVTPMGQILNKIAGKDIEILDMMLPDNLLFLVQQCLILAGILVLSFFTTWLFIIPLVPFSLALMYMRNGFHKTSVQVRRLESGAISPIYSLFGSVVRGTSVIRAFGLETSFLKRYKDLIDHYIKLKVVSTQLERRFALGLNLLASVYIFLVATTVVLARSWVDTSMGMLAVVYSLRLIGLLQMTLRFYTAAQQSLTAVQRIESLQHIPLERPPRTSDEVRAVLYENTPADIKKSLVDSQYSTDPAVHTRQFKHLADHYFWPWRGKVEFKNISLRYRPDLPLVLNKLNVCIEPGDVVGVLGRTGSGKSTLIQSLFNILLPETGTIEIDGIDIMTLGMADLRSRIALVPQTPTCFAGTVRSNLDPMGRMTDAELNTVLDWVSLSSKVNQLGNGLDSEIEDGGANLSASERQLLCIGRALLTQFRAGLPQSFPITGSILVSDEATSSIPNDELVNSTIDNAFKDATRIVIAHRLHTVITCTKILILRPLTPEDVAAEVSSVMEYDIPWLLLNSEHSEFRRMCMAAGEEVFCSLYQTAKECYFQHILPQQASFLASQVSLDPGSGSGGFNVPSQSNSASGAMSSGGVGSGRVSSGAGGSGGQGLLPVPTQLPIFPSSNEPLPSTLKLNSNAPPSSLTLNVDHSNRTTPESTPRRKNGSVSASQLKTPIISLIGAPSGESELDLDYESAENLFVVDHEHQQHQHQHQNFVPSQSGRLNSRSSSTSSTTSLQQAVSNVAAALNLPADISEPEPEHEVDPFLLPHPTVQYDDYDYNDNDNDDGNGPGHHHDGHRTSPTQNLFLDPSTHNLAEIEASLTSPDPVGQASFNPRSQQEAYSEMMGAGVQNEVSVDPRRLHDPFFLGYMMNNPGVVNVEPMNQYGEGVDENGEGESNIFGYD